MKKQSNKRKPKKNNQNNWNILFYEQKIETKNADRMFQSKNLQATKKKCEMFFKIHCFRCFAHSFGYIRWKHIET